MKTTRSISFSKPVVMSTESSFVKSFNIYGLTSSIYIKTNNSQDKNINITPCCYAPNGPTGTVYLDYNYYVPYGSTGTEIDRYMYSSSSVENFFSLLVPGTTLTIVDAGYNYEEFSLNGSYIFSELINSIVVLQGITIEKLNPISFKYYPEKFDNNPRIILGASVLKPLPDDQLNIENIFSRGTNSLINQGILPNDVIEHGEFKLKVISLTKNDINGHENLIVDISDISHTKIVFDTGITTLNLYRSSQTPVVKTPVVVTPVVLPTNMNMNSY
jgi:hypothetical protein